METTNSLFSIRDLRVAVEGKEILQGVTLEIGDGEVHAMMGPNGSGKSTLSNVIMGHPSYEVTGGKIFFKGEDLTDLTPDERARLGLFLAFQYPSSVPGVSVARFLKSAHDAIRGAEGISAGAFLKELRSNMAFLGVDEAFINRALNDGFSGGERKRMEVLQMLTLKPRLAIMDETDSGLDIDALRVVSKGVNRLSESGLSLLVITHYERILKYIKPDHLHILIDGRVALSGGPELVKQVENKGYDWIRAEFGQEVLV